MNPALAPVYSRYKNDLLGRRFGKLLIVFPAEKHSKGVTQWLCRCDCGVVKTIRTGTITQKGAGQSCGCARNYCSGRRLDVTGQTFGRLTALRIDEKKTAKTKRTYWVCSCSCGNTTSTTIGKLRSGHTISCGCRKKDGAGGRIPRPHNAAKIDSLFSLYKTHAKQRNYEFMLSRSEFANILQQNCVYCGNRPAQEIGQNKRSEPFYYNGIDRVNNKLGYTQDNCVACCKWCNYAKGTKSRDEFFAHMLRIAEHNMLQEDKP